MANKNIQITQRNADNTAWDNLFPNTKSSLILMDDGTPDYVRLPGYGTDTGSAANTYVITLSPAPTSYVDGMGIAVKIAHTSTGASTINVNSLGAKTILNPDGTAIGSGDLVAGSIYSLKYNTTTGNFILVCKGGVKLTGTAQVGDVLSGKTFYNTDAKSIQTGTMVQGKKYASGTGSGSITVRGLSFCPNVVIVTYKSGDDYCKAVYSSSGDGMYCNNDVSCSRSGATYSVSWSSYSDGFGISGIGTGAIWYAYE